MKRKYKLSIYLVAMCIFILILALFGGFNIYNSSKIINNQKNSNFIFYTDSIRKSANKYFISPEEETEHCKELIRLTIDSKKLSKILPKVSQYDADSVPYVKKYLKTMVSPFLLYACRHVEGLVTIYFDFDHELLKNKDLIGLWYMKVTKGVRLLDNGPTASMYPKTRSDLAWYYLPKKMRKGVWSEPYRDVDLGINMISYSTPVFANNKFLGIVGMDISMDELRKFVHSFNVYKTEKIYLINKKNKIIFADGYSSNSSTRVINEKLYNFIAEYESDKNLNNDEIRLIKVSNNKIYTVTRLYNDFVLVIEVAASELYGDVTRLIVFTSFALILAILISILILTKAYKMVKKVNDELLHKEKLISIGTMAAEIAHEINNPIGYLNCNMETLEKYVQKIRSFMKNCESQFDKAASHEISLEEEVDRVLTLRNDFKIDYILENVEELIAESKYGIRKISAIIFNLKNFSKDDSKYLKNFEKVNVLIEDALKIIKTKVPKDVTISTKYEEMPELKCNKIQLQQVVVNIIDNAFFAVSRNKTREKNIKISSYKRGRFAYIEIEDNGEGIEKSNVSKVFDSFYTTKNGNGGTGLGLSIAYQIITEKHYGQISVESKKDFGTKFTIKIPYKN